MTAAKNPYRWSHINRAGKNLSARRKRVLETAKDELRRVFGRA
jgi:hypothetical protein